MKTLALVTALGVAAAAPGLAQGDRIGPFAPRLPEAAADRVRALADSAAAQGLPVGPLIEKALEGGAKGAAPDRIVAAVGVVLARLGAARAAISAAGLAADSDAVEAGAFALSAGLTPDDVQALSRSSRPPYVPATTLRVAGTLAALGVVRGTATGLVQDAIASGQSPAQLLDLPHEVQAAVGGGATPTQAANGLGRGQGQGQGGGGNPHGTPPGQSRSHKP